MISTASILISGASMTVANDTGVRDLYECLQRVRVVVVQRQVESERLTVSMTAAPVCFVCFTTDG